MILNAVMAIVLHYYTSVRF